MKQKMVVAILAAVMICLACCGFMTESAFDAIYNAEDRDAPVEVVVSDPQVVDWEVDAAMTEIMERDGYVCVSLSAAGACDEWRYSYIDEEGNTLVAGPYAACFESFGDLCGRYCDASWPEEWCGE